MTGVINWPWLWRQRRLESKRSWVCVDCASINTPGANCACGCTRHIEMDTMQAAHLVLRLRADEIQGQINRCVS